MIMRKATYTPDPLPHQRAPTGAPDRYVTTDDVAFDWRPSPRSSILDDFPPSVIVLHTDGKLSGVLALTLDHDGCRHIGMTIASPFYFAVSVAPSFGRARPAAALHDFLYEHVSEITRVTGRSRRYILHVADRWFFSQLDASGFLLKRTYYVGVRIFGYWFNTIFGRKNER